MNINCLKRKLINLNSINTLPNDAFKLPDYRIKNLNKRIGKNNGKSPSDNRSKNKKNKGGKKKPSGVIFNPRY